MAGMFDFVEQPEWMKPSPSQATGLDILRDARSFYERRQQQEEAKRQFNALLPIKEKMASQESTKNLLDVAQFMQKRDADNNLKAQYSAVMDEMANIQKDGLMDKPEGRAKYFQALAKNPAVAASPSLRIFENNFDIAQRAQARAEQETMKAEAAKALEEQRAQHRADLSKAELDAKKEMSLAVISAREAAISKRYKADPEKIAAFKERMKMAVTAEEKAGVIDAFEGGQSMAEVPVTNLTVQQQAAKDKVDAIDEEIRLHKRELASGDERTMFLQSRTKLILELEAQKRDMIKSFPELFGGRKITPAQDPLGRFVK
jgi:hypothetical protein